MFFSRSLLSVVAYAAAKCQIFRFRVRDGTNEGCWERLYTNKCLVILFIYLFIFLLRERGLCWRTSWMGVTVLRNRYQISVKQLLWKNIHSSESKGKKARNLNQKDEDLERQSKEQCTLRVATRTSNCNTNITKITTLIRLHEMLRLTLTSLDTTKKLISSL